MLTEAFVMDPTVEKSLCHATFKYLITNGLSTAAALRAAKLPIRSAVVLLCREFEHWFVACMPRWAAQPVIHPKTNHQPALAATKDFPHLQQPGIDAVVPAFGTHYRACQFLAKQHGNSVPETVCP